MAMLRGSFEDVRRSLTEKMEGAAENLEFEAAAVYRDRIESLSKLWQKQKVVASPDTEQDVIALYSDDFCSCISIFYIRSGVLSDTAEFLFGADSIVEEGDLVAFLCDHYQKREYIPSKILLANETEESELAVLSEYLSMLAGRRVHAYTPERGALHTLCNLVEKNAAEKAKRYRIESEVKEDTLTRLASLLRLETYPDRIEAYDISNLGSEHLTAGMIVCRDGKFAKADYRSFKIKSVEGTDDYASMRETLARRLSHLSDVDGSFSELPDLILLDGGKGHVSVIRELLTELGLEIPVFGMVKDDYHKTRALCTDSEEISIAKEREIFSLIYRIQEEVHRYTVNRMESAKRKTVTKSVLTKINGIGESKAKKLLAELGGLAAVKSASLEVLMAVKGISERDAQAVWKFYHERGKKANKEESDI
jgi:excinuclease ABC subunit C